MLPPALLSIQYFWPETPSTNPIFWSTWGVSLGVGLLTNYMKIFKVDQEYYVLKTAYMKLKSEGWQFLNRTGKYNKRDDEGVPLMHSALFSEFCGTVEKIVAALKQAEIELSQNNENGGRMPNLSIGTSPARTGRR